MGIILVQRCANGYGVRKIGVSSQSVFWNSLAD